MRPTDAAAVGMAAGAMQRFDELEWILERYAEVHTGRGVLEIGCGKGGLTRALLAVGGPHVGITLPVNQWTSEYVAPPIGSRSIYGDSHDSEIMRQLDQTFDLIVIDGDHTYAGVEADWYDYRGFCREGGIVAFHDLAESEDPDCQVHRFWPEVEGDKEEFIGPSGVLVGWGIVRR